MYRNIIKRENNAVFKVIQSIWVANTNSEKANDKKWKVDTIRFLIFCFLLFNVQLLMSQQTFEKVYKLTVPQSSSNVVCQLTDGGYIIAGGEIEFDLSNNKKSIICRLNPEGESIWNYCFYPLFPISQVTGISVVGDTSIWVVGNAKFAISGYTYYFLTKLDMAGNPSGAISLFGGQNYLGPCKLISTLDNGMAITGNYKETTHNTEVGLLIKTDSEGLYQWETMVSDEDTTTFENINSVLQLSDSSYFLSGYSSPIPQSSGNDRIFIARIGKSGNIIFAKTIESPYSNSPCKSYDACLTASGDITICASVYVVETDRLWLVKTNHEGDTIETYKINIQEYSIDPTSIALTQDGGYAVGGNLYSLFTYRGFISRISPNGALDWTKHLNSPRKPIINDIIETSDGGIATSGMGRNNVNMGGLYILKTDMDGLVSRIHEQNEEAIIHVFPNPISDFVTISWQGQARMLTVIKMDGSVIFEKTLSATQNELKLQTSDWPNGLYLIRFKLKNGDIISRKLIKASQSITD
ncbi:MAG: T9SS type A sorting domain-containing protein [Bacteroidales bacterium]|jgi:hypothetical protein|nr:T9SS type A sorting domain-containing protein [Bacteroidales bacterium]